MPKACDTCRSITAAILAGGLGTRLRPALQTTPKVLARVGQKPFITLLLDQLQSAGFRRVVLLTGYRADEVRATLGTHYGPMTLIYSEEKSPLGTAGALRQALPKLMSESVLLMNGDSFCDVDLPGLVSEHQHQRADMTLTLTHVADTSRFGKVTLAADNKVTHFGEKLDDAAPGLINAGIYVLATSLVTEIPEETVCSLERDLLPDWVTQRRVYGFPCKSRFLDIGTPASYASAPTFFKEVELQTSK